MEASSRFLIFPLFDSEEQPADAGCGSVNGGRLAPPESGRIVVTGFWQLWLPETRFLRSERKRRLLHNFPVEKMRSECTIFPYAFWRAFLRKSTDSVIQIRPAHSSL